MLLPPHPRRSGTRPATRCMKSFFIESFSWADRQGVSAVVPMTQKKSAPPLIWYSISLVSAWKSIVPSALKGVITAIPSPLNLFWAMVCLMILLNRGEITNYLLENCTVDVKNRWILFGVC